MTYTYPFTAEEMQAAYDEFGCNCGPAALAFALQIGLDKVRVAIPGFEDKGHTTPTMMKQGLLRLGKTVTSFHDNGGAPSESTMFGRGMNLVRIQWTGPWTKEGANPKWAYRQTHWIATWGVSGSVRVAPGNSVELNAGRFVFDCNGGVREFDSWQKEIVPTLTALYPRADGG